MSTKRDSRVAAPTPETPSDPVGRINGAQTMSFTPVPDRPTPETPSNPAPMTETKRLGSLSVADTQSLLGSDRPVSLGKVPTDPIGMRMTHAIVRERLHDEIPRRIRLDVMTAAERAIYDAVLVVEAMPADVQLTDAVILLGAARDAVADFVDGSPIKRRLVQMTGGPVPTPETPSHWQPMETAPKDGLIVLLAEFGRSGSRNFYVGHFASKTGGREHWLTIPGAWERNPTHWMPLPDPPLAGAVSHPQPERSK